MLLVVSSICFLKLFSQSDLIADNSSTKAWLMIPRAEPEDVDIYLDEFLCEEDINAINKLIDSLIEKEIYRFEGALWRMEKEE